jgi:hypothetical protein
VQQEKLRLSIKKYLIKLIFANKKPLREFTRED